MNLWYPRWTYGINITSKEVGKVNVPWCVLWTLLHMDWESISCHHFWNSICWEHQYFRQSDVIFLLSFCEHHLWTFQFLQYLIPWLMFERRLLSNFFGLWFVDYLVGSPSVLGFLEIISGKHFRIYQCRAFFPEVPWFEVSDYLQNFEDLLYFWSSCGVRPSSHNFVVDVLNCLIFIVALSFHFSIVLT